MKVDLDKLRLALEPHAEPVTKRELEALLAVVDAVRVVAAGKAPWRHITAALEPFTPPADRAWEEVDRWNAERDLAVKAAVDAARSNPRDRARDLLADAGVVVQRQFRSDQERIAELESELAEARRERDWAREETKLERAGRLPIGRGIGTKP